MGLEHRFLTCRRIALDNSGTSRYYLIMFQPPPTKLAFQLNSSNIDFFVVSKMTSDLYPGFSSLFVETPFGASIFVRSHLDGKKLPLLLLHGFPQTHAEFHKIVPSLTSHFSIVLQDLRGYGASSTVPSTNGTGYSKRLMAENCIFVMGKLDFNKFSILGHDRGARVAYRLAYDHPEAVVKVVVVDIVPTSAMFRGFGNVTAGIRAYHWLFLAQPEPFPETLIRNSSDGAKFLEHTLASWTGKKSLQDFHQSALEEYKKAFCTEARIYSTCEDYRAGAFIDRVHDEEELMRGNKIDAPVLAVWGSTGLFAEAVGSDSEGPLQIWKQYASNVDGKALKCGHFIPEEDPEGLVEVILPFLSRGN